MSKEKRDVDAEIVAFCDRTGSVADIEYYPAQSLWAVSVSGDNRGRAVAPTKEEAWDNLKTQLEPPKKPKRRAKAKA